MLSLDKIIIFNKDGETFITLPRTKNVETTEEMVYTETTMASGKTVMDIRGYRPGFSAEWEWLPAGLLAQLLPMLRQGGYFNVSFVDATGEEITKMMKVTAGGQKIFKFVNGAPMWYGLTLDFTAQEVVSYD